MSGLYWSVAVIATSKSVTMLAKLGSPDDPRLPIPPDISFNIFGADVLVDLLVKRLNVNTIAATGLHNPTVAIS